MSDVNTPTTIKSILSGNQPFVGITRRRTVSASHNVSISWSWYNENQGIVSWNFANNSTEQKSVILFRSGYYFGNAYYPIYVANGMTSWATSLTPLEDNGIENNTMPIGIVDFNGKKIVAFIFTLAPGQKWSVLEGGFSTIMPPTGQTVYEVTLNNVTDYCIGYDQTQVLDWDMQTQTTMQGFMPNPSTINTVEVEAPSDAPYVVLFPNDTETLGQCNNQSCLSQIEQGISQGNTEMIFNGIICLFDSGLIDMKEFAVMSMNKLFKNIKKDIEHI